MLIRHMAIPKRSNMLSLVEPQQKTQQSQAPEYPVYLARTLNPQQPIVNGLISPTNKEPILRPNFIQENNQFSQLRKQHPQNLQFIDYNYPLQQDSSPKKIKIFEYARNITQRNHQQKSKAISAYNLLSNHAYFSHNSDLSLQDEKDHQQKKVINKHAYLTGKTTVYNTIQKFKSRGLLFNQTIDQSHSNYTKKYSYSLRDNTKRQENNPSTLKVRKSSLLDQPQQPLILKKQKLSQNQMQRPQQDQPIVRRPYNKAKLKSLDKIRVFSQTAFVQRKKMPSEESTKMRSQLLFEQPLLKHPKIRKTSEQQWRLNKKAESELDNANKIIKFDHRVRSLQPKELNNKTWSLKPTQEFHNAQFRNPTEKRIFEISFRTSIAQLKQICALGHLSQEQFIFKVPQIFAYPVFSGQESQDELFQKTAEVFKQLKINKKGDLSIKKYLNCVMSVYDNIALIWHFSGRVYLGGWRQETLGAGMKQGLGLQWFPKKYFYYGQFARNKREGLGIMKTNNDDIFAGSWRVNKFCDDYSEPQSPIKRLQQQQ